MEMTQKEHGELVWLVDRIVGKRNEGKVSEIMRMLEVIEMRNQ